MKLKTTLLTTFLVAGSVLSWADDVKIGSNSYSTLKEAVDAVVAGTDEGTIQVTGVATIADRIEIKNKTVTIEGVGSDAVLKPTKDAIALLVVDKGGGALNLSNVTIDGNGLSTKNAVIECNINTSTLNKVTFKNIASSQNQGFCAVKNSGTVNVTDVTIGEGCSVPEGRGFFFTGRSDGIILSGDNSTVSIYIEKNLRIKANNLTNTKPIDVILETANRTENGVVVAGYTDASKFNFIGCAEGFGVEHSGTDLKYVKVNYVAKIGSTGYKSLQDALKFANTQDDPTVINVIDDCATSERFIPSKVIDLTIQSEGDEVKTISRFAGTNNNTMFELNTGSGASKLTFKNVNLKNENGSITNAVLANQSGTISLENVEFNSASTDQKLVQVKGGGTLNIKDSKIYANEKAVGEVYVNKKGNLKIEGNNVFTLKVEAAGTDSGDCARLSSANLTNTAPIEIVFDNIDSYVGLTLISGATVDDVAKFTVPEGYVLEAGDGGLVLKEKVTEPELPVKVMGDANYDGKVTVSDVVTIANVIVSKEVDNFHFASANVVPAKEGEEEEIDIDDLQAVIDLILNDASVGKKEIKRYATTVNDCLVADNFQVTPEQPMTIGVALENTAAYSTLRADVIIPEGMTVEKVEAGPRAAGHEIVSNVTADGVLKLVIYSLSNASFADCEGTLFNLIVNAKEDCGNITFGEIRASDISNDMFDLGYSGGANKTDTTGIESVEAATNVEYYNLQGVRVANPDNGIYIRVSNGNVDKVIIRK